MLVWCGGVKTPVWSLPGYLSVCDDITCECGVKLLSDAEATLLAQLQHSPGHTDRPR